MSLDATNPTPNASANPSPGAEGSDFGSRPNIDHNTVVYVPHPGLDDGDEQPARQESQPQPQAAPRRAPERRPANPAGTANRPGEGGQGDPQPQPSGDGDQAPAQPFKVIKYKGREVAIDSEEKYHELASQGFDYTVKTQMLAPHMRDLQALARLRSTPEGAARLEAILRGEDPGAIPAGQAGGANRLPGQGGGQSAPAKLPEIYVRDGLGNVVYGEDGQPVKADPTFVHAVRDMLQAMGFDQPGQTGQGRGPAPGIPPELAPLVTERQVAQVEAYVKQSFDRDDFRAAIPAIQETMLASGIVPGDPRDNPDTWLNIYTHLAMTGGIPAPAGGQANGGAGGAGGQGDPPPSVRRPNKSAAKEAGQVPAHQMNQPPGRDLDAAIARATERGRSSDWQEVVGLVVDHPALHME